MRPSGIVRHAGIICLAMAVIGCGDGSMESPEATRSVAKIESSDAMYGSRSGPAERTRAGTSPAIPGGAEADGAMVIPTAMPAEVTKPSATAGRKIIYNGHIDLVTEDLAALEAKLLKLIEERTAYVADSDRTGAAGSNRRGTWKVRVPVEGYDAFVKGAAALGEVVSLKADSQDVSEEFYDLDARQAAKKVEEQRLLKHLTESTGKLDEILAVERELSRVRIEIERMQGRLRALANLTSLATVTITASEIKGYVPPQAPTLGTKVARTFAASLDSLQQFGEAVLIACVAIVPWLPLMFVVVGLVVWIARRSMARYPADVLIDVPPPPTGRG
jgi:hypothetical protein